MKNFFKMMGFKIKENKYRAFLIFVALLLISGWFYWFEIRPSQIKHDCSWVKNTNEAIPAKPGMSEAELRVKGLIQDCTKVGYRSIFDGQVNPYNNIVNEACERENKQLIEDYKTARPAVPAKDWWKPANPQEYSFCLHDKGL